MVAATCWRQRPHARGSTCTLESASAAVKGAGACRECAPAGGGSGSPPPDWRQQGRPRRQYPCCRHQRQCPLGWRPTATTEAMLWRRQTMEAAPLPELQAAALLLEATPASASFLGPAPAAVQEAPFTLEAAGATTRCSVPARGARCSAPAGSSGAPLFLEATPLAQEAARATMEAPQAGGGAPQAGGGAPQAGGGAPQAGHFSSLRCCVDSGMDVDTSAGVFGSVDGVIGSGAGGVLDFDGVSESGGVPGGSTGGVTGGASTEEVSVLEAAPASAAPEAAPPFDVSGAPPPALKVASLEASLEAASTDSASVLEVAAAAVEAAATRATV